MIQFYLKYNSNLYLKKLSNTEHFHIVHIYAKTDIDFFYI